MAALLNGALSDYKTVQTICIILSGGNVDPEIANKADQLI